MKTQEIQLEADDDLTSIRDHMAWAHTPRVLLIWPLDGGVKINPSDLLLVARQAETLGQELGIVSRDRDIQAAAGKLNLSVFARVVDAQENQWQERRSWRPERRSPRADLRQQHKDLPDQNLFPAINNPRTRLMVFAAGVLAVLIVLLLFIPSAEIQITPPAQDQQVTISVSSDPQARDVQISGLIPQHVLSLPVSGQDSAPVTGSLAVADQKATGLVILTNLTGKAVDLPAGSLVTTGSTPALLFETTLAVQVPAGKGKTASVQVQARVAGPAGNLMAGAANRLAGGLASLLSVNNPTSFSGGTQKKFPMATDQDRDSLRKKLLAGLQQQALDQLRGRVGLNDVLFLDTIKQERVTEEIFTPPAGQAGDKLSLNLTAEFSMSYASGADLHDLAGQVLDASLPAGYSSLQKQIEIKSLPGQLLSKDGIHWQIQARRKIQTVINPGSVIALVQGKSTTSAAGLLTRSFGLTERPRISVQPGWWPWLPFLPISITVRG